MAGSRGWFETIIFSIQSSNTETAVPKDLFARLPQVEISVTPFLHASRYTLTSLAVLQLKADEYLLHIRLAGSSAAVDHSIAVIMKYHYRE